MNWYSAMLHELLTGFVLGGKLAIVMIGGALPIMAAIAIIKLAWQWMMGETHWKGSDHV